VTWTFALAPGASVPRVWLNDATAGSSVRGLPAGTPVIARIWCSGAESGYWEPTPCQDLTQCFQAQVCADRCENHECWEGQCRSKKDLAAMIEALSGLTTTSFHTCYESGTFIFGNF
jgi:hypothetical protein